MCDFVEFCNLTGEEMLALLGIKVEKYNVSDPSPGGFKSYCSQSRQCSGEASFEYYFRVFRIGEHTYRVIDCDKSMKPDDRTVFCGDCIEGTIDLIQTAYEGHRQSKRSKRILWGKCHRFRNHSKKPMPEEVQMSIIGNDTVHEIVVEKNSYFVEMTPDEIRSAVAEAKAELDALSIEIQAEDRQAILYYSTVIKVDNWLILAKEIGATLDDIAAVIQEELEDMS